MQVTKKLTDEELKRLMGYKAQRYELRQALQELGLEETQFQMDLLKKYKLTNVDAVRVDHKTGELTAKTKR